MQLLPGEQQNKRFMDYTTQRVHRTLPFVNSHDTYRPILSANGNFSKGLGDGTGWNTGGELGGNGQHIDPREPRLFAAYATIFAVDGNPTVFFEDLFDVGTTGKRYSHLPNNPADLPIRQDIVNIILSHQKLAFKDGNYAVPTALTGTQAPFFAKGTSGDHLVIERTGKALIGITDKYSTVADNSNDEEVWVSVSDPSWFNRDLIDYSGAHGLTTTRVFGDGRVLIKTAPVAHSIPGANGHGYSIWAPIPTGVTFNSVQDMYNYLRTYQQSRSRSTTQEWEMADDLGDSHAKSLRQGGQLPLNSTAERTAGSIFAEAGKPITVLLFPAVNGRTQRVSIYNAANQSVSSITGTSSNTAPLTLNYTPTSTGWFTIRANSSTNTQAAQQVWINVTYTAPPVVNTRNNTTVLRQSNPVSSTEVIEGEHDLYPNPTNGVVRFNLPQIRQNEVVQWSLYNANGALIGSAKGSLGDAENNLSSLLGNSQTGIYVIQLLHNQTTRRYKVVRE
jgi:alpha-amylase